MEWHQLEYFKTVAQMQHFTRAAETLTISQPALSRSIARLEDELGVPLFERQGRSISLNRYGQIFLKYVNRAMQEIAKGQQEIQDLISPSLGNVSLAFIHTLGYNLVPDLLGTYRKIYPEVDFQLSQNTSYRILDQLETDEIDFCLCSQVSREDIHWVRLLTQELYLIVPKDHPLAGRGTINLKEIALEPFIAFKDGTGLREISDRLCKEAEFTPRVTFEGEEVGTVAGLVAAKLGVALVPQVRGLDKTKITQLRVAEPLCRRDIGLAWVKDRYLSPAAKGFQEFVLEYFHRT